jgi:hypothetical protein
MAKSERICWSPFSPALDTSETVYRRLGFRQPEMPETPRRKTIGRKTSTDCGTPITRAELCK